MIPSESNISLSGVAVIIPALNEAESLRKLLPMLRAEKLGQIIVCDNGSTDETREVVRSNQCTWVYEPRRGYGAACFAGMRRLADFISIVVFLDADLSDDPVRLRDLVFPILAESHDFVVSARTAALREQGAMTFPQRVANVLFPLFMRIGWGFHYTDMGPFRAISRWALDRIDMQDRAYGWTIEMQIRAVEEGLRICEIPVSYRRRAGKSKISGTVRGVVLAAYWIVRTCAMLFITKRSRSPR